MNLSFEPLRREHLPLLREWLCRPHVARWWGGPPSQEAVEAEYVPSIEGHEPTWHQIVLLDGRPVGMVQWYRWSSYPGPGEDGDIGAQPTEAGVDYLIGEPDLLGRGIGPAMLRRFLDETVLADQAITGVRTSVHAENRRSWRCLEKLGFTRTKLPHPQGHMQYVMVLERTSTGR